jgi:hypothetical protein
MRNAERKKESNVVPCCDWVVGGSTLRIVARSRGEQHILPHQHALQLIQITRQAIASAVSIYINLA